MGTVYMAYDIQLDRRVAIKVISPEISESMDEAQIESILKRFQAEAKLAAMIDHPNVVRIYSFNQDTIEIDGVMQDFDYLVMELFSGRTLRNTMDISGFEHQEEIENWIEKYLIPLLDGLQKVHESGIIHRDIKPENFMMKDEVPKLADFGLSLGFSIPSITGNMADIFGSITYMAPEQFYNFSMAREPADIYSIGKILYELVDGKISEKTKPFKQVMLSNPDTDYLRSLNCIIMAATEENPNQRIGSALDLKSRLLQLIHCPVVPPSLIPQKPASRFLTKKVVISISSLALLVITLSIIHFSLNQRPLHTTHSPPSQEVEKITYLAYPDTIQESLRSGDGSMLHLIPPATIRFSSNTILNSKEFSTEPFYLSEMPITNQQYVDFLNKNISRIRVAEDEVYLDNRLLLKLSEKIRGYKPILFINGRFLIQDPMHSSCAVLMVTGLGAESYAHYYGLRLPQAEEWYYVMKTGINSTREALQPPVPVLDYRLGKYGLRGINQVAEWGQSKANVFVIMGPVPSAMVQEDIVIEKNSTKYYTDTSFRVAKDASPN
ncbi:MAG: serine/threonine protein kinase [Deltaproteobacteria bacterium]|nr:serine/threonine protein kinase [Deltaproteobacteria bacterium]